jgi:predicted secreted protein
MKSWSVQVDSLDVMDTSVILSAIANFTPFTLIWDEVDTADNQTATKAAYCRKGQAYLNDVTFNWNDRENSAKQIQFTGIGQLEKVGTVPEMDIVPDDGAYTKGQFVRLFLGSDNTATPAKIVAAAKSLSLHISVSLEDATTKDTTGDWQVQEPTAISYDITSDALVKSGDTITSTVQGQDFASIEAIYEAGTPVRFQIANTSGVNNRTKGPIICSGSVVVTQLTLNAPNRQNATFQTQLTGYGSYIVAA